MFNEMSNGDLRFPGNKKPEKKTLFKKIWYKLTGWITKYFRSLRNKLMRYLFKKIKIQEFVNPDGSRRIKFTLYEYQWDAWVKAGKKLTKKEDEL